MTRRVGDRFCIIFDTIDELGMMTGRAFALALNEKQDFDRVYDFGSFAL